jgi:hypothetical protein
MLIQNWLALIQLIIQLRQEIMHSILRDKLEMKAEYANIPSKPKVKSSQDLLDIKSLLMFYTLTLMVYLQCQKDKKLKNYILLKQANESLEFA